MRATRTISARRVRAVFGAMLRRGGRDVAAEARAIEQATRTLDHESALTEIDRALGGHGVESLNLPDGDPEHHTDCGVRFCPAFSYVNMGDPYTLTVLRDHENGAWIVACYGDVVEWWERRNPGKVQR